MISLVFRRLCGSRHRLLRVREHFIHEALALAVHIKPRAGINHEVRIRVGVLNDRAAVELIHMNEHRAERLRHRDVFTRDILRTAQHEAGKRTAHIAAEHRAVRGEAAGTDHDTVTRHIVLETVVRQALNAHDPILVIGDEFQTLRVEADRDLAGVARGEQIPDQAAAARHPLAIHRNHAVKERPREAADLRELQADLLLQPLDIGSDVFNIGINEGGVGAVLRHLHHVSAERFFRFVEPLSLLKVGTPGGDTAGRENRVPGGPGHFF